jgi:hypothetical protein
MSPDVFFRGFELPLLRNAHKNALKKIEEKKEKVSIDIDTG